MNSTASWLGLALLAILWFGIWHQVSGEFRDAEHAAHQNLKNFSRVFDEHIKRTVNELDKALLIARKQYNAARDTMPYTEAIGLRLPDPALLSDMSFQLAIVDRDGILRATTIGAHPPTPIELEDRPHFQVHKTARPDIPHISKPVIGRRSGLWSIQLTRRIEGPDGRFDGIVATSMDPGHFGQLYGSIDFGDQHAVIFAGDDGVIRTVTGTPNLKLGDQIGQGDLLRAAASGDGVYRGDMDGSGTDRIFAIQRIESQPLFVAVGMSPDVVFAAAEQNRIALIAAGGIVSALVMLALLLNARQNQQISHMAHYDDVTKIPNRVMFQQLLRGAYSELQNGKKFALLLINIDHFKATNDSYGQEFGDKLLCAVAERLQTLCGKKNFLARLTGDEFGLIVKHADKPADVTAFAEDVLEALRQQIEIGERKILMTASIGSAIASDLDDSPQRLFKYAELALADAKNAGRDNHRPFRLELAERFVERLQLESDLREALDRNQLELYYQPIQSLDDNAFSSFEVLLRWNHPFKGCISPAIFIPVAEESGLIVRIGEWVLNMACEQAMSFSEDKGISVNLSPVQFRDPELFKKIKNALEQSQLPPERLELEITESVMMKADDETMKTIRDIRALGIRIAMDDFGVGYSSLGYLCKFEFDRIKIDRSFIAGLERQGNYTAVIRTIVALAQSMGVKITAEGIESLPQLEMIRAMGCTEAQGFLLGRPQALEHVRYLTNPKKIDAPKMVSGPEIAQTAPGGSANAKSAQTGEEPLVETHLRGAG